MNNIIQRFVLVIILLLTANFNYAYKVEENMVKNSERDINFSMTIKYKQQSLQGAVVKILINNTEVARAYTNTLGVVDISLKSYNNEEATIVIKHEGETNYLNIYLLEDKINYDIDLYNMKIVATNIADNKEKDKNTVKGIDEISIFKAIEAEKEAKQAKIDAKNAYKIKVNAKKKAKEAAKISKAKLYFEKKRSKILNEQKKINKSNAKLDKIQKKLNLKKEKASEEIDLLKIKDKQLKLDKSRNDLRIKQKKLDKKLEKLNKKYTDFINKTSGNN